MSYVPAKLEEEKMRRVAKGVMVWALACAALTTPSMALMACFETSAGGQCIERWCEFYNSNGEYTGTVTWGC